MTILLEQGKPQLPAAVDEYDIAALITPPLPPAENRIEMYPRDYSGQLYSLPRLFSVLEALQSARIDRQHLLSAYNDPSSVIFNKEIRRSKSLAFARNVLSSAAFLSLLARIKITRRQFLSLAGIASGGTILATTLGYFAGRYLRHQREQTEQVEDFARCGVVLPDLSKPVPEPVAENLYEQKSILEKANYLLQGGYVTEWTSGSREDFYRKMTNACRQAVVESFAQLMGEDVQELTERVFIATTKEEYISKRLELGFTEEASVYSFEHDRGFTTTYNDDGEVKPVVIINLPRIQEYSDSQKNPFVEGTSGSSDTLLHELIHLVRPPRPMTDEEKAALINWLNAAIKDPQKQVQEVLDPAIGLEIDFISQDTQTGNMMILLQSFDSAGRNLIWDEILREFSQQEFRHLLDRQLGQDNSSSYYTNYPYFLGYSLLSYFHEKIDVEVAEALDFFNRFRTHGDVNMVDLLKLYADSARQNDRSLSETHMIMCLLTIEALGKTAEEHESAFSNSPSQRQYIDYICALYELFTVAKLQIDDILTGGDFEISGLLKAPVPSFDPDRKLYAV